MCMSIKFSCLLPLFDSESMIRGKWIVWMTDVAGKSNGSYKNCDHVLVKKKAHRSATVLTVKRDRKRREMDGFIWQIRQPMLNLFIFWLQLFGKFLTQCLILPACTSVCRSEIKVNILKHTLKGLSCFSAEPCAPSFNFGIFLVSTCNFFSTHPISKSETIFALVNLAAQGQLICR